MTKSPKLLPLTAEEAAAVPASMLLLDLIAHVNVCGGACDNCRPKLTELDERLPPRKK